MSLLKSIATYVFSALFVMFLYLAINSYTLGGMIQRDSIEGFIQSQMQEDMLYKTCDDLCSNQSNYMDCNDYCSYLEPNLRQACAEDCSSNISRNEQIKQSCIQSCMSRSTESQDYIHKALGQIYDKEIFKGVTIDSVSKNFMNTPLFVVLTVLLGLSVFLVSEKPVSKMGNNIILVSISLLSLAAVPLFIVTDMPAMKLIFDYLSEGLYQQIISGIVLLAVGIVLIIIGKKKNK